MHKSRTPIGWVLLNVVLGGIAGSALAWGPLALPWVAVAAVGVAGMALGGWIAWWSHTAPRRRWVWIGHGAIVLGVAAVTVVPLYRVGAILLPTDDRLANFDRLTQAMTYAYPYFDVKGIDWEALVGETRPQVAAAETDEAYWRVVALMLAELGDGHTGMQSPSAYAGRHYFASCIDVDGAIVIDQLTTIAEEAGLAHGDAVVAVDDVPVEEALAGLSPLLRGGSSPQHRRATAVFGLLSTRAETMTVSVSGPGGDRTVTLTWPTTAGSEATQRNDSGPTITGERLPSGVGLIRVPQFGSDGLVAEFDAALDSMMDAPGIILDLRGNGGGSTFISDQFAGRLLTAPYTYGRDSFRVRLPQRGWRSHFDYRVTPRGETYSGAVVLLTDARTLSTAENFVVALVDAGRATTVGRQTGGGSGNPIGFDIAGGARVRFSTGDFRRNGPLAGNMPRTEIGTGARIEGIGIAPDVPVTWTVAQFRAGEDPDVAAAERVILGP